MLTCSYCNSQPRCVSHYFNTFLEKGCGHLLCPKKDEYINQDQIYGKPLFMKKEPRIDWIFSLLPQTWQEILSGANLDLMLDDWMFLRHKVRLTERQGVCLFLYYWQKTQQDEIGQRLNISVSVVAGHLHAAKKKVKTVLDMRKTKSVFRPALSGYELLDRFEALEL